MEIKIESPKPKVVTIGSLHPSDCFCYHATDDAAYMVCSGGHSIETTRVISLRLGVVYTPKSSTLVYPLDILVTGTHKEVR